MQKRIVYAPVDVTPDYGQPSSLVSGAWNTLGGTPSASSAMGNGTLRASPIKFDRAVRLDRIGAEVTTIGEAGSLIRLGIYRDNGNFYPGNLILDAGTILGDSAAIQAITIDQALAPGVYWLCAAVQSAPTTQPTVRIASTMIVPGPGALASSLSANTTMGVSQAGVSGALPAAFTSTITVSGTIPRILWRLV